MLEVGRPSGDPRVPVHRFGSRTALLELHGECDAACVDELIGAVAGAVEGGRTLLVVDLSEVTFLDSAFLTALSHVGTAGERHAWEVMLVRPRFRQVWRWFELTELGDGFTHFPTRGAALAAALARETKPG